MKKIIPQSKTRYLISILVIILGITGFYWYKEGHLNMVLGSIVILVSFFIISLQVINITMCFLYLKKDRNLRDDKNVRDKDYEFIKGLY